jgi:arsenite methyltransferase
VSQLEFDEDAAKRLEAMYRIGDAVRRRAIVREALGAAPGERVLDVGCGPGFYCAELLEDVGPSGSVLGLDGSAAMLSLAAGRCAGHDNVEFLEADATSLPVEDASFDATLSLQSDDPALTDRVLSAWDEHLAHPSLPRTLAPQLRAAGLEDVRMQAHPFVAVDFDPDRYGPALIPFIGTFVAGRQGLTEEDAQAWVAGQRELGERGGFYFAITQFCFTARKPR